MTAWSGTHALGSEPIAASKVAVLPSDGSGSTPRGPQRSGPQRSGLSAPRQEGRRRTPILKK